MFVLLLALLLATLATYSLSPSIVRFIGRSIGRSIQSKTQHRREILLNRAESDEKDASKQGASPDISASSSSSINEEEWEKVQKDTSGLKTPTADSKPDVSDPSTFTGIIAFFHPFCNAGGGGERVLFAAILATQKRYPRALCVVYTGDHDANKDQILTNVRNRFNISLNHARVSFLYLSTREYVLATKWPRFTLLGQSLGSLILGWEAFNLLTPDIYIDTMGYAFTLALSKFLFPNVPTGAYVHYPTISTDMLRSLHSSTASGQGVNAGLGKGPRGKAKQWYWELFAKLYSWVGGSVDVVMTNSTWTQNHVSSLWSRSRTERRKKHAIAVVYPPCAVEELREKIPVSAATEKSRTRNILYIAQFRPEKQHHLIIDAFASFLKNLAPTIPNSQSPPKLILVGSVRDDHDEKRVYKLRLQANEIKDHVEFVVNAKWPQVLEFLKSSNIGVNGMWNEHFGIGVVEYQAAGLISVVNNSGGPKEDIVVDVDGGATGKPFPKVERFDVK